jgi:hypothetical protein
MTRANLKFNVLYSMGNLDGEEAYESSNWSSIWAAKALGLNIHAESAGSLTK